VCGQAHLSGECFWTLGALKGPEIIKLNKKIKIVKNLKNV
jgi:hypothetical protein